MLVFTAITLFVFLLMQPLFIFEFRDLIGILFPKGFIAREERDLLLIIQSFMLIVIIPLYLLTFIFSWKYRAQNFNAKYDPNFVRNRFFENIWWIPCILTVVISILSWVKTSQLDPYKPIISDKKEITIQVVALQWKWLFIYPEEKIACVNFVQFPQGTPIHFEITADAPMNSLWIPQLAGQIYAMPKMKTQLHLMADQSGDFRGSSANLSGEGFAGMHFIARASSDEKYQQFIESAQRSVNILDFKTYDQLAAPSKNNPVEIFKLKEEDLFNKIVDQ